MSTYGIFESIEGSDGERKIASRDTQRKLDAAIDDVKNQYGAFLFASRDGEEWNDRVALCKDDMIKTVNAHLMPVTGVMRRIVKACKDEWKRTADKTGPAMDNAETFAPKKDKDLKPKGDFDAYLNKVDQNSDAAVDNCFKEGYRYAENGVGAAPDAPTAGTGEPAPDPIAQAYGAPVSIPGIQASRRFFADGSYQDTYDAVKDKNKGTTTPSGTSQNNNSILWRTPDDQNPALGSYRTPDGKVTKNNPNASPPPARSNDLPFDGGAQYGKGGSPAAPAAAPPAGATTVSQQSGGRGGAGEPASSGGTGGGGGTSTDKIGPGEYTIQSGDTYSNLAQRAGWGDDYKGFAKAVGYQSGNEDNIFAGDKINVVGKPSSTGAPGGGNAPVETGIGGLSTANGFAGGAPGLKQGSLAVGQYIDWCDSFGYRRASVKNLDIYAQNLNDRAYFEIASALTDPDSPIYRTAAPVGGNSAPAPQTTTDENGLITNNPVNIAPSSPKALNPMDLGAGPGSGFGGSGPSPWSDMPGFGVTGGRKYLAEMGLGDPGKGTHPGVGHSINPDEFKGMSYGGSGKGEGDFEGGTPIDPDVLKALMARGASRTAGSQLELPLEEEPQEWDTAGLQRDYHVDGFQAPFVVVRRKSDGQRGSLEFERGAHPRVYRNFVPHHGSRTAATDYLQKADEALTNLLNQRAEEFQQTIAPLQQALQTVQQAEALQQAQNPLGVQPPAGTVNVLPQQPGGDPSGAAGGGDQGGDPMAAAQALAGMGGGDPSMGGGDPSMQMQARRRQANDHPKGKIKRDDGPYHSIVEWDDGTESREISGDLWTHGKGRVWKDDKPSNYGPDHPAHSEWHNQDPKWRKDKQSKRGGRGKGRGANAPHHAGIVNDVDEWGKQRGVTTGNPEVDMAQFQSETGKPIGPKQRNKLTKPISTATPMPKSKAPITTKMPKPKMPKAASFFTRKVAGWDWDDHLNGYLASKPTPFTCKCGAKHPVPSYSTCKCGKIWNSYVIGTGGDNHQASVEKFICREIPVRDNVIVARRRKANLNITQSAPPKDKPVILMYGGAFNPPHSGHVGALQDAQHELAAAGYKVGGSVVVPTADKLLAKKAVRDALPLSDRASVARIAFPRDIDGVPVDVRTEPSEEVERSLQKPRRSDLARWAQQQYPNHTIVNVTGEDAVVPGAPPTHPSIYSGLPGTAHEGVNYLTMPRPEGSMSSSKIRAAELAGEPIPGMSAESERAYREALAKLRGMVRQGSCNCWKGYERVPGTKPCAPGSCRKCDSHSKKESGKVKRHNLSDPGPLGEGKDDKMPDISEDLGRDWHKRGPGGKYARKRRG